MDSNSNRSRNFDSFKKGFWFAFLGLTFIFALIWFGSTFVENLTHKRIKIKEQNSTVIVKVVNATEIVKKELIKKLSERNTEIYTSACEKSKPEIEKLKKETIEAIRNHTSRVLNLYFSTVQRVGVEKFLNWLYSFGTDYMVVFNRLVDAKRDVECYLNLKRGEFTNLSKCVHNSELERYILQKVKTYLVNDKKITKLVEEKVIPYANGKVKEFEKNALQILSKNYKEELQKEAKKIAKQLKEEREFNNLSEEEISKITLEVTKEITPKIEGELAGRVTAKTGTVITAIITAKIVSKIVTKMATKIAEKVTLKVTSKVLTKLAEKLGAKAASALGGFEAGTLACGWLGPFSVACGAVAGAIVWFATDVVVNKLDEVLNRDEMRSFLIKQLSNGKNDITLSMVENDLKILNKVEKKICPLLQGEVKKLKAKELPQMLK